MFGLGDIFTRELRVPVTVRTVTEDDDGKRFVIFENGWALKLAASDGDGGFSMVEVPQEGDVLVLGVQAMVYKAVGRIGAEDE